MGVYDGAAHLRETMDSVLSQKGVALELVVVDDGSSDATPAILEFYASQDARVRIRRQGRLGLTRALIAGCAAARAPVIARQDCGDVSLPGRFAWQLARLRSSPGASLVSAGAEFFGPRGEWLYAVQDTDATLEAGLSRTSPATTRGPSHHGATMFSRAAYRAVGGYRAAFAVAQDLDLWMRLWEQGCVLAVPEILYRARLRSARRRARVSPRKAHNTRASPMTPTSRRARARAASASSPSSSAFPASPRRYSSSLALARHIMTILAEVGARRPSAGRLLCGSGRAAGGECRQFLGGGANLWRRVCRDVPRAHPRRDPRRAALWARAPAERFGDRLRACMIAILATHPIQYQTPVWRMLAARARAPVKVYYLSRQGLACRRDPGFGRAFAWDVELLDGYEHEFARVREARRQDSFFWLSLCRKSPAAYEGGRRARAVASGLADARLLASRGVGARGGIECLVARRHQCNERRPQYRFSSRARRAFFAGGPVLMRRFGKPRFLSGERRRFVTTCLGAALRRQRELGASGRRAAARARAAA